MADAVASRIQAPVGSVDDDPVGGGRANPDFLVAAHHAGSDLKSGGLKAPCLATGCQKRLDHRLHAVILIGTTAAAGLLLAPILGAMRLEHVEPSLAVQNLGDALFGQIAELRRFGKIEAASQDR